MQHSESTRRVPRGRRLVALAACGALALTTLSVSTAAAKDGGSANASPGQAEPNKLDPELTALLSAPSVSADDARTFRVIVNFSSSADGAGELSAIDGQLSVITRYQTIPAFSAEVDAAALTAMAERAEVTWIEAMPTAERTDVEALALTGGDLAHDAGFRGQGATIAVIDDGIDTSHPAFGGDSSFPNDKVVGGADFGDFDLDPRIDCTGQFHGTPVSGIAVGDGGGVTGAAPGADLVHVKVQSARNCGSPGLDGDIVGAMDWVVANQDRFDIDVMSMSLGSSQRSSGTCDTFDRASAGIAAAAKNSGIVIVAASGNDASKSSMSWPACLSDVVSVGSVYDANIGGQFFRPCSDTSTTADQVTCYSNSGSQLDILAPSEAALTARSGGGLTSFGGTSSATPFAAGVFAVLAAEDQSKTPDELIELVKDTGVDITDDANGIVTPRVDFVGALNAL